MRVFALGPPLGCLKSSCVFEQRAAPFGVRTCWIRTFCISGKLGFAGDFVLRGQQTGQGYLLGVSARSAADDGGCCASLGHANAVRNAAETGWITELLRRPRELQFPATARDAI